MSCLLIQRKPFNLFTLWLHARSIESFPIFTLEPMLLHPSMKSSLESNVYKQMEETNIYFKFNDFLLNQFPLDHLKIILLLSTKTKTKKKKNKKKKIPCLYTFFKKSTKMRYDVLIDEFYGHSLGDCCSSVCVSVCLAYKVYILVTMDRILMKRGGSGGTQVTFNVLKFDKNRFSVTSFLFYFCFFCKGIYSVAKGNLTTTAYPTCNGSVM